MTGTIKHGTKRANGFTLVELLIVLALLALLAGLTIPRLFGVISRSRLQQAAQQLAGDLGTARLLAIQCGCAYEVRIESAGTRYTIRPRYAANPDSLTMGLGADDTLPTAQSKPSTANTFSNQVSEANDGLSSPSALSGQQMRRPKAEFIDDELNGGVRFGKGDVATQEIRSPLDMPVDENTTDRPTDEINSSTNSLGIATSPSPNWTRSVIFYPDGRAEKHNITLSDNEGRIIELTIRGLTGGVTIGPITRPVTFNVDPRNGEAPINGESMTIAESQHAKR